jgi:hypothetical protein
MWPGCGPCWAVPTRSRSTRRAIASSCRGRRWTRCGSRICCATALSPRRSACGAGTRCPSSRPSRSAAWRPASPGSTARPSRTTPSPRRSCRAGATGWTPRCGPIPAGSGVRRCWPRRSPGAGGAATPSTSCGGTRTRWSTCWDLIRPRGCGGCRPPYSGVSSSPGTARRRRTGPDPPPRRPGTQGTRHDSYPRICRKRERAARRRHGCRCGSRRSWGARPSGGSWPICSRRRGW